MIQTKEFIVSNQFGLYARVASRLTQVASGFKSEITLQYNGITVNAKSIMGVMRLAVPQGHTVVIAADGEDADKAVEALVGLANRQFGISE